MVNAKSLCLFNIVDYFLNLGKEKKEKECFEIFQKQIDALKPLRETLWNYYNLHKLTKLP